MRSLSLLRTWPARRWWIAVGVAVAYVLIVGISTAMIETPVFGRDVPTTWWAWPALIIAAALSGLLTATYVRVPGGTSDAQGETGTRRGMVGALLTWFAVGCPVCNKIALLVLGYAGAMTWFAPLQPFLWMGAIVALVWALAVRLRGEVSCALPVAAR